MASVHPETAFRFPSGPLSLDGLLSAPAGAARACVVCHPHPLYGGDMRNAVVATVTRSLREAGLATLRFDFRGAGSSEGRHDGGKAEVFDALAAVQALGDATGLPSVAVAGYSFGAMVALLAAAADSRIDRVVAVAPPLAMLDAGFADGVRAPLLVVTGDRDQYCPREAAEAFASRTGAKLFVLAGADHFLGGREDEAAQAVRDFLAA